MELNALKNIVEAALLAAHQPMTLAQLAALFGEEEEIGSDDLGRAIEALREDCEGRGVELVEVASGFRYQVRQDVHPWVARMWTERPSRYSRALLETMALIAYRQPITRGEIEQIRGVTVSSNIVKTLEDREWIRVVGHRDVPGKPALFGTTRSFLDYFNLTSLDQLPPLSEIRDLDELDPQLDLGDRPAARAAVAGDDQADAPHDDADAAAPDEADAAASTEASADAEASAEALPSGDAVDDDAPASEPRATADEAEAPADGDDASAQQDTEENRA